MMRRRRRVREIAFSFDSFLDIVANVVGVIIRLILVVWVGARSYSSIEKLAREKPPKAAPAITTEVAGDPLQQEIERHRRELADAQKRLLAQLRELKLAQHDDGTIKTELNALTSRRSRLDEEGASLGKAVSEHQNATRAVALSSADIQARSQKLAEEIRALEHSPLKKILRYRTPIGQPVHSEELLFECNHGRVTFIDIGEMLQDVRQHMEDKGKLLHARWRVEDVTATVGAFHLRYAVERERGVLDALGGDAAPGANSGSFRYGLSEWQIEPIALIRGEPLEQALRTGSEFRQIVDGIDPLQTAVTFWVYPDSFDLFRRLRDLLYERDVVVAGRPLPDGVPIASSRRGTVSRGQ